MRKYKAKSGATQYMPSVAEAMVGNENNEGFCLACGHTQGGVEPDARKYRCESCGAGKVYGFAELVLMGLSYDA